MKLLHNSRSKIETDYRIYSIPRSTAIEKKNQSHVRGEIHQNELTSELTFRRVNEFTHVTLDYTIPGSASIETNDT